VARDEGAVEGEEGVTTTLIQTQGVELTPSQLEPIGWFLLAVLEWEDPTTPTPALPLKGEGGRRKRKAVCVSSPVA
jgi:hypothetical protein